MIYFSKVHCYLNCYLFKVSSPFTFPSDEYIKLWCCMQGTTLPVYKKILCDMVIKSNGSRNKKNEKALLVNEINVPLNN